MSIISRKIHIAKTLSWRMIATVATLLLSWAVSGSILLGTTIGVTELFSKSFLYYLHERLWHKISLLESRKRHLLKTLTWRFIGTLDTIALVWFITGDASAGAKIGMAEMLAKMLLYYAHERFWYSIYFNLKNNTSIR